MAGISNIVESKQIQVIIDIRPSKPSCFRGAISIENIKSLHPWIYNISKNNEGLLDFINKPHDKEHIKKIAQKELNWSTLLSKTTKWYLL